MPPVPGGSCGRETARVGTGHDECQQALRIVVSNAIGSSNKTIKKICNLKQARTEIVIGPGIVCFPKKSNALILVLLDKIGKNLLCWNPLVLLCAQHKQARCPRRSPIAIDERMNVGETPQDIGCQHKRIGFMPIPIDGVGELIHEIRNLLMLRGEIPIAHCHFAGSILACKFMQADYGMVIERFQKCLRQKGLLRCNGCADDGIQKIIMSNAILRCKLLINRVVFSAW